MNSNDTTSFLPPEEQLCVFFQGRRPRWLIQHQVLRLHARHRPCDQALSNYHSVSQRSKSSGTRGAYGSRSDRCLAFNKPDPGTGTNDNDDPMHRFTAQMLSDGDTGGILGVFEHGGRVYRTVLSVAEQWVEQLYKDVRSHQSVC